MRNALPLVVSALVFQLVLMVPGSLIRPTPELPVLLLLLVLGGGIARLPVAAGLLLLAGQKIADLIMMSSLGRPFNIAADLSLVDAGLRLVGGTFGPFAVFGVILATFIATLGISGALWWATGRRTSFTTPFYAETHLATLRRAESELAQAGLAMRSGFLTSPTQGGQSWLAHASFASGLWIADQSHYQAVLTSGRQGLFHYARREGFRTAAVMPAITRPWPEAAHMGFDHILTAPDLGYRGLPFNWVTMPDQFTLAAADLLLRQEDGPPLFAQIALISSHAPWVPVPHLIDWDEVRDGSVFSDMAVAGESLQEVWRDRDNIRRHYRMAIDYALQTVTGYALRHADEAPLIIVLGDHQTTQRLAPDGGRDVPMHVIGPEALVRRSAGWGFTPGLIPADDSPAIPMDRMRDLILQGFSTPETPG